LQVFLHELAESGKRLILKGENTACRPEFRKKISVFRRKIFAKRRKICYTLRAVKIKKEKSGADELLPSRHI
jgi:hypothetical protein